MRIAILLTSTVRPQVAGANFSVPERMEMYRSTLQYYAETIGREYPVVLVENSDADLSVWEEEFKDSLQLEILQFTPHNYYMVKMTKRLACKGKLQRQRTMASTIARARDTMST